ncbi:MAG: hypothetical protein M5U12_31565 [Verrucomicrobia bacterium]|nr:hypothetical protein [Verrucomicrobiota bacterium]
MSGRDAALVNLAVQRIRPILAPLGEYGYKIIPEDVFSLSANATPEALKTAIMARLDLRHRNYGELRQRIADGQISYLELLPRPGRPPACGRP